MFRPKRIRGTETGDAGFGVGAAPNHLQIDVLSFNAIPSAERRTRRHPRKHLNPLVSFIREFGSSAHSGLTRADGSLRGALRSRLPAAWA